MAIVGASYTAGVGPGNPALAWSADLARSMHWKAAIYGDSGVGYARLGALRRGPVSNLLSAERLRQLAPSLVIVQAGHNDAGVRASRERSRVRRVIKMIRTQAPRARIALLTVFTAPSRPIPARFYRADHTIVRAARAADPRVIIMDPLLGRWKFQHLHHGLHPTARGDAWIARKVKSILHRRGIFPAPPLSFHPMICDVTVSSGHQTQSGAQLRTQQA